MKTFIKLILILISACLLVVVVGSLWYRHRAIQPYRAFRASELEIKSRLDDLNNQVAGKLPPLPPGAEMRNAWANGIEHTDYKHGRWYHMTITSGGPQESIASYYGSNLLAQGWQINDSRHKQGDGDYYYLGTACLSIKYYFSQQISEYEITIWQDYQAQSFTPKFEDQKLLNWLEFGMTKFASCP